MSDTVLTDAAPEGGEAPVEAPVDVVPENSAPEGAEPTPSAVADGGEEPAKDGEGEEPEASGAGEFVVSVPEGFEDHSEAFTEFQTDMGAWLTANPDATPQQALQEAANRQANQVKSSMEQSATDQVKQIEEWEATAKSDPEIGGEKFDENIAVAKKALEAFGNPEFSALLADSGLGSHPDVLKFVIKAGASLKDAPVIGGGETPEKTDAQVLKARFPSSPT